MSGAPPRCADGLGGSPRHRAGRVCRLPGDYAGGKGARSRVRAGHAWHFRWGAPRQVRPAVLHSSGRAREATQPASSVLRAPPSQTQGFKTFPDSCPCLRKVTSHTGHGCHLPRGEEAAGEVPAPGRPHCDPASSCWHFGSWRARVPLTCYIRRPGTAGDSRGQLGTAGTGGRGAVRGGSGRPGPSTGSQR